MNLLESRGDAMAIDIPIFVDSQTPRPFIDHDSSDPNSENFSIAPAYRRLIWFACLANPDFIHMDAVVFGSGCCCLQMTLQGRNLTEARKIFDILVPLAPVMVCSRYVTEYVVDF